MASAANAMNLAMASKPKSECQPATPQMASTCLVDAVTPTPVTMAQIVSNQQQQVQQVQQVQQQQQQQHMMMMTAVPPPQTQLCALGSTPETFMTATEPFPNMI